MEQISILLSPKIATLMVTDKIQGTLDREISTIYHFQFMNRGALTYHYPQIQQYINDTPSTTEICTAVYPRCTTIQCCKIFDQSASTFLLLWTMKISRKIFTYSGVWNFHWSRKTTMLFCCSGYFFPTKLTSVINSNKTAESCCNSFADDQEFPYLVIAARKRPGWFNIDHRSFSPLIAFQLWPSFSFFCFQSSFVQFCLRYSRRRSKLIHFLSRFFNFYFRKYDCIGNIELYVCQLFYRGKKIFINWLLD